MFSHDREEAETNQRWQETATEGMMLLNMHGINVYYFVLHLFFI